MDLLDEAASLIRQTPLSTLALYYLGALPFSLALIYFWFDMTQGADAEAHLPAEALVLTGLYFWMKTCQAVFARHLLAQLEGRDADAWTRHRWVNTALLQVIFAGAFVVVYPVALLVTIPFGWVSCFFHNLSIVATGPKSTISSSYQEAAELARLWPRQNHLIIGILLITAFVLFLNLAIFFIMIPQLLNMLFGIETIFDENNYAWNNSSFYLDVFVFCFLILNPINKAIYVLRCFYGRSRKDGADLKSALRLHDQSRTPPLKVNALALLLALSLLGLNPSAHAEEPPPSAPAQAPAQSDPAVTKLDQAIQKTLQKDEYSWRLPRAASKGESDNWITRSLRSLIHFVKRVLDAPAKWLAEFLRWLFKRDLDHDSSSSGWMNFSQLPWRFIFISFAVCVLAILIFWLARFLKRREPAILTPLTTTAVRTVDLEAEDVQADDLPEDSWLALAQQMIEKGEMRLAVRAFYLATLSVLAQQQLVRLGPAKSNRDYILELTRRLRGNATIVGFFRENIRLFEASWYGTHDATAAIIETMRTNHQHMRSHAAS
jgi:hypothetical protein